MIKPSLPQGTRDFSPAIVRKRQYILNILRQCFELYGFEPLETPAMENLDTLLGKYGEEGDKLIFKILNNGLNDPKNEAGARAAFERVMSGKNDKDLTARALRYDLTIPFARFVAMNHGQLHFPFKRYQIQPVWRADRPQKGRYREFYQCDADIVGSTSLLNEVELASLYSLAFEKLRLPVEIRINSREILTALAEASGDPSKLTDITVAIDKLDKTGLDKVLEELQERGIAEAARDLIKQYLSIRGDNAQVIRQARELFGDNAHARHGLDALEYVLTQSGTLSNKLVVDLTLARGLNYYTGIIFEVRAPGVKIGSIGGGGRYDDLTGLMGVPGIPGVGISFGVDRIYDVLEELHLFPESVDSGTRVLFFNLGAAESQAAFAHVQALRRQGIAAELFHEQAKMDKQFRYAEKKQIPFVVILGSKELENGTITMKNIRTGEQQSIPEGDITRFAF